METCKIKYLIDLRHLTKQYFAVKKDFQAASISLINAKTNMKNLQIWFWNDKTIRDNPSFNSVYKSSWKVYTGCRDEYARYSKILKDLKGKIKDKNRLINKG